MPQRVVPVLEAGQNETSETGGNDLTEQNRIHEEMKANVPKQLSQIYGPILRAMKLSGEHFGETIFTEDTRRGNFDISRYYSTLVVLGQWVLAIIGMTSLFYEGFSSMTSFLYLLVTAVWYVQCACSTTICLVVLPLAYNRRSRFAQFVSSFLTTGTELEGLRLKALKGLTIACTVSVINSVVIVFVSIYYNGIVSVFKPWDHHLAIRVIEVIFGNLNSFAWTLPVLIFCITCLVLERMFEMLRKKVISSLDAANSFTIARLRQEHLKLCEVVELADKVFSPLLFVIVALDIPLICTNVFQLTKAAKKWSSETDVIFFIGYFYWSVCATIKIAVLCTFGHRVTEKVRFSFNLIYVLNSTFVALVGRE